MKNKLILAVLILSVSLAATAGTRPRAMGIRTGAGGIGASYQHGINMNQFIQGDMALDLGYNANGRPGITATATYNFIWARPVWSSKGTWSLYSGPGISLGAVNDLVPYQIGDDITGFEDNGFMIAAAVQVGLEYEFTFPLQLSVDIRPCFGIHANNGHMRSPATGKTVDFQGKTGFYDNGLLGFIPSISVRYRF